LKEKKNGAGYVLTFFQSNGTTEILQVKEMTELENFKAEVGYVNDIG
jgi:hypothetical protein